ncbi:MAG: hypothetical protein IH625_05715 [Rhodobacteraceae bacterium]|nr:hypothetical protein [Paracoccaceae bacterium]
MVPARPLRRLRAALMRLPVLLALAVIGLLPPGVMPTQAENGQIVMVICSTDGPVRAVYDAATGTLTELPDDEPQAPCHWSLAQAAVDLVAPVALPVPAGLTRRAAPELAVALWRPAHDPRGLYARGPPSLT